MKTGEGGQQWWSSEVLLLRFSSQVSLPVTKGIKYYKYYKSLNDNSKNNVKKPRDFSLDNFSTIEEFPIRTTDSSLRQLDRYLFIVLERKRE